MAVVNELMPAGKPDYLGVISYPKICDLLKVENQVDMLILVSTLVRDFCSGVNVARNMNEDQILEAAAMLLNECGNFRLEDYAVMFSMAKKGQLVKFYERIDLEVITAIVDAYWIHRNKAAQEAQEQEANSLQGLGPSLRIEDGMNPQDAKLMRLGDGLAGALSNLKIQLREKLTEPPTFNNGAGTMDAGTV